MTFTEIFYEIKMAYASGQPLTHFYNQFDLYQNKKKELRPSLLSGCFSYMSFLPFFVIAALFVFIPKFFIVNWELTAINLILYSQSPIVPFVSGLILSLVFRDKVKWFLPLLAFMQYIQAAHIAFTLFAAMGVFLGLVCAHAIKTFIGFSKIKFMYLIVNLISWVIAVWGVSTVYSYLVYSGLLANDLTTGRNEILSLSIGLFIFSQLALSAVWGHFYIQLTISNKEV